MLTYFAETKAVVCVIHGISFGLAIDLSLCADVRVASADARMAVKEVDIGLAADIGTLARLPKAVGSASWVKDVCLSAREFGADEALRVGFVSEVRPTKREAVARAVELASTWASKSPVAVQGTKEILNHARDHSVADSKICSLVHICFAGRCWDGANLLSYLDLRYTAVWNSVALQSADVKEALLSGMRRTKPTFEKL